VFHIDRDREINTFFGGLPAFRGIRRKERGRVWEREKTFWKLIGSGRKAKTCKIKIKMKMQNANAKARKSPPPPAPDRPDPRPQLPIY